MTTDNYSSSVILWIDDRFEGVSMPDENTWSTVFGAYSDQLFRLMDLNLEAAASYEEAMERIHEYENAAETGVFLFCIVDLRIPVRRGLEPKIRCGVAVAKELKRQGVQFVFLSANSDATDILGQHGLGATPYYIKEFGKDIFQLPRSLTMKILNEFRNHISWVKLVDIIHTLHPNSDIAMHYRTRCEQMRNMVPLTYFPYFGAFRNYVERCEFREMFDFRQSFTIRSTRQHCDLFVQQALLILFHQDFLRTPRTIIFNYGHADDPDYISRVRQIGSREASRAINVIRVTPETTDEDEFKTLLNTIGVQQGKTIFVIPNDESADQYTGLLLEKHIMPIEELPQDRDGDPADREELVKRSSALAFQQWALSPNMERDFVLTKGYLQHTELLLNPINWMTMLEADAVAEDLSDPYEIVKEFMDALNGMSKRQRSVIRQALKKASPIPYKHLLLVGDSTFKQSEFGGELHFWIERVIGNWLNVSWRFPYALKSFFLNIESGGNGGGGPRIDWNAWEDNCYEILVEMLDLYKKLSPVGGSPTPRGIDLERVAKFIDVLGGKRYKTQDVDSIDWDALECLRWPHTRYPMPSAINRRLREAGRYLWIQPEGLDLATTLPAGRTRYKQLNDIVAQYWTVLTWGKEAAPSLPGGWRESIDYLIDILSTHRVEREWKTRPGDVWTALKSLIRNGGPVMFIADQAMRGKPLSGKGSAGEYLESVNGYGKILSRLRVSRRHRVGGWLTPVWPSVVFDQDLRKFRDAARFLALFENEKKKGAPWRLNEIFESMRAMLNVLAGVKKPAGGKGGNADQGLDNVFSALAGLVNDPKLKMMDNKDWYIGDVLKPFPDYAYGTEKIPSLLGSKIDYLWEILDLFSAMERATRRCRHYDGYHFFAAINDLRVWGKDADHPTGVELDVIENVLELFVASLEGLLAQLSFCARLAGETALADRITPPGVVVRPSEKVKLPTPKELSGVMEVKRHAKGWSISTLGIPGEGTRNRLCFDRMGEVVYSDPS